MPNDPPIDPISQSDRLLAALRATPTDDDDLNEAVTLLPTLRNLREFGRLSDLAELVSRYRRDDATTRRLYAQALIECGRLTVAVQLLENTLRWPSGLETEYSELQGLRGRAYKQLFVDTTGATAAAREAFLRESVAAYRAAFDADPAALHWPGVNLCALTHMAQRLNINIPGPTSQEYAKLVLDSLDKLPERDRNQWWHATKAEAHLALGELPEAETHRRPDTSSPAPPSGPALQNLLEEQAPDPLRLSLPHPIIECNKDFELLVIPPVSDSVAVIDGTIWIQKLRDDGSLEGPRQPFATLQYNPVSTLRLAMPPLAQPGWYQLTFTGTPMDSPSIQFAAARL